MVNQVIVGLQLTIPAGFRGKQRDPTALFQCRSLPQGGIPDSLTGEEECYAMLSDTLRYPACDAFTVGYALQGKKLCVTVSPETLGRWEIWTACMPANPMDQRNTALILRTRGANVTCCVTYCIC